MRGRCECGGVRFEAGEVRPGVTACHCGQCRRTSGHVWASTVVPTASVRFEAEEGLTWYASSDSAERGFCARCGSSLFWRALDRPGELAIAAGCLEDDGTLRLTRHIFVEDKGAYYEIGPV